MDEADAAEFEMDLELEAQAEPVEDAADNIEDVSLTEDEYADADIDTEAELLSMDEAVLDEDALRDMVSEIVRQELQGALGERITRNVRKLVRREIHRALTSQDMD